jgi:hypothetical protein
MTFDRFILVDFLLSSIIVYVQVTCTSCKTSFCFQCGQSWHEPIKCKWLRKWQKKCHDDSETSNWIAANTKECPKCHATIGKSIFIFD